MAAKRGLGRGLEALIEAPALAQTSQVPRDLPVDIIDFNPLQPRSRILDKDLKGLIRSVKDKGIIEPLIVRATTSDRYELIAGERRLRAAREAGLERVPVVIREADRADMLELALIENLHREDLNPIEEAESYQHLAREFNRTQEEIARLSGKDRSTVANLMRLLNLPEPVIEDVRQARLSAGHARSLLSLEDFDHILAIREEVLTKGLSVRETESLVKKAMNPPPKKKAGDHQDQAWYKALSEGFTRNLGSKVRVMPKGKKGRIEISYNSTEELEQLMNRFGVGPI